MLQDAIVTRQRHNKFIEEVVGNSQVWLLENASGVANSTSHEYEDQEGNSLELICFWSDRKRAKVCAKEVWSSYTPKEIPLAAFLENWCIGLANDNRIIGTNFDWNMFGYEIDPLELIIEIITELKKQGKSLSLRKFSGIEDLEAQVKEVLEELN
ncbi:MAG: DUF2750 domain-containing protein [Bacteroidota bacterium]